MEETRGMMVVGGEDQPGGLTVFLPRIYTWRGGLTVSLPLSINMFGSVFSFEFRPVAKLNQSHRGYSTPACRGYILDHKCCCKL